MQPEMSNPLSTSSPQELKLQDSAENPACIPQAHDATMCISTPHQQLALAVCSNPLRFLEPAQTLHAKPQNSKALNPEPSKPASARHKWRRRPSQPHSARLAARRHSLRSGGSELGGLGVRWLRVRLF